MADYLCAVPGGYAGKYTVDNNFWNNVCERAKALGYDLTKRNGAGELPVTRITFYDAVKLCNALNEILGIGAVYFEKDSPVRTGYASDISRRGRGIRLPEEREWENAAGGGDTLYFWGNEKGNNLTNKYAWMYDEKDRENAFLVRRPGLKCPNEYGLYDMSGNVYEWCFDKFRGTNFRIMKGGAVTLDSVLETRFTSYAPEYTAGIDIGMRIFADEYIEIPRELYEKNESGEPYKNRRQSLFDFIDLDTDGLGRVKALYEAGKTRSAVREYVLILKERARDSDFDNSFFMPVKEEALSRLMAGEENFSWFDGKRHFDTYKTLTTFAIALAEKYRTEHDAKYLEQFIKSTQDTLSAKDEFDNLPPEALNRVSGTVPDSWCYTQGFDSCARVMHVCKFIVSTLLKYIDEDDLTEAVAEAVAENIVRTLSEDLPLAIKDSRSVVPNQALENAMSLILAGKILYGLREGRAIERLGYERMTEATVERCVFPDGTDMEQSYNYNFAICKALKELMKFLGKLPEELEPMLAAAKNRIRFLKTVSYPHGGHPATGTMSGDFPPIECDSIEKTEEFARSHTLRSFDRFKMIDDREPNGETVCFPYSATTVMKSGTGAGAVYMWHFAARAGSGHAVENVNSVQLSAYGMPMLVSAGASTYNNIGFVPESQREMIAEYEKYQHSSNGANTVLIDGKSQGRLKYGENVRIDKYGTCCGNPFYSDEFFDYVQGRYFGVYYDGAGELEAEHLREIIHVKRGGVFIIRDTVTCAGEHTVSARFGIMPEGAETRMNTVEEELYLSVGYRPEEVHIDGTHVYTDKKGRANFEMYAIGESVEVKSEYGEKAPCRGWLRGAIRSGAKEKYDISFVGRGRDKIECITVIAVSGNEQLPIRKIEKDKNVLKISLHGCEVSFDGEKIMADGHEFALCDAKAPTGFKWIERDGKIFADYEF